MKNNSEKIITPTEEQKDAFFRLIDLSLELNNSTESSEIIKIADDAIDICNPIEFYHVNDKSLELQSLTIIKDSGYPVNYLKALVTSKVLDLCHSLTGLYKEKFHVLWSQR